MKNKFTEGILYDRRAEFFSTKYGKNMFWIAFISAYFWRTKLEWFLVALEKITQKNGIIFCETLVQWSRTFLYDYSPTKTRPFIRYFNTSFMLQKMSCFSHMMDISTFYPIIIRQMQIRVFEVFQEVYNPLNSKLKHFHV